MSESKSLTTPIVEAMQKAGYFCMRLNSGMAKIGKHYIRLCPKGTADIAIYLPNRPPIWCETKTADGHTNREQIEAQSKFRDDVEALGHTYVRATSLDQVLLAVRSAQEQLL